MRPALGLLSLAPLWARSACSDWTATNIDDNNMVQNPDFEDAGSDGMPLHWSTPADVFSRTTAVTLPSATASLMYNNSDPKLYKLASQKIVGCTAGGSYTVSAAVKTAGLDVSRADGYATVCVQWSDHAGKWLGGVFPRGPTGTSDWTTVHSSFVVPSAADPASVEVSVYVRPSDMGEPTPTGLAFFDNVSLYYAPKPPLSAVLLSPVYRGRVTAADADPISVRARVRLEHQATVFLNVVLAPKNSPDGVATTSKIMGPFEPQGSLVEPLVVDVTLDGIDARNALKPGEYTVTATLLEEGDQLNKTLSTCVLNITRMDDGAPLPKVYIDSRKRTILDGKAFFPIGMYFSTSLVHTGSPALANLSGTAFNMIMPYGEATMAEMDAAAAAGLKVGFSLKDIFFGSHWCPKLVTSRAVEEQYFRQRVADFSNHSALLAWYTNDELTTDYLPQLKAHQQWLVEDDPDHPSWQVLCEDGEFDQYMGTFDVIGSDPYPIGEGNKTASGVHEEVNTTVFQTDDARPVWEVIQAMNWANYRKGVPCPQCHTPTYSETRSMVWQSVAAGANGIVFYEYADLLRNPDVPFVDAFGNLKSIAAELAKHAPVLLSDAGKAPNPVVASGDAGHDWLMTRAQWSDGKSQLYVLFVVSDGSGNGTVAFEFGDRAKFGCKTTLSVVRIMEFDPRAAVHAPQPQVNGCAFSDNVPLKAAAAYQVSFE